jgi:hypothetical protein
MYSPLGAAFRAAGRDMLTIGTDNVICYISLLLEVGNERIVCLRQIDTRVGVVKGRFDVAGARDPSSQLSQSDALQPALRVASWHVVANGQVLHLGFSAHGEFIHCAEGWGCDLFGNYEMVGVVVV